MNTMSFAGAVASLGYLALFWWCGWALARRALPGDGAEVLLPLSGAFCTALLAGIPMETINQALALDVNETLVFSHIIETNGRFVVKNGNIDQDSYFTWLLDNVNFIAEYDSRTFNMGFIASIWDNRFEAMFELQNMRWINFGLRYKLRLK